MYVCLGDGAYPCLQMLDRYKVQADNNQKTIASLMVENQTLLAAHKGGAQEMRKLKTQKERLEGLCRAMQVGIIQPGTAGCCDVQSDGL